MRAKCLVQVHNTHNMIFLVLCRFWSQDLPHHKRALYHWATVPLTLWSMPYQMPLTLKIKAWHPHLFRYESASSSKLLASTTYQHGLGEIFLLFLFSPSLPNFSFFSKLFAPAPAPAIVHAYIAWLERGECTFRTYTHTSLWQINMINSACVQKSFTQDWHISTPLLYESTPLLFAPPPLSHQGLDEHHKHLHGGGSSSGDFIQYPSMSHTDTKPRKSKQ